MRLNVRRATVYTLRRHAEEERPPATPSPAHIIEHMFYIFNVWWPDRVTGRTCGCELCSVWRGSVLLFIARVVGGLACIYRLMEPTPISPRLALVSLSSSCTCLLYTSPS